MIIVADPGLVRGLGIAVAVVVGLLVLLLLRGRKPKTRYDLYKQDYDAYMKEKRRKNRPGWLLPLILLLLIAAVACAVVVLRPQLSRLRPGRSANVSASDSQAPDGSAEQPTGKAVVPDAFQDGVLDTEKFTLTIKNRKVLEENQTILFFYDVTNKNDDDLNAYSAWYWSFDAYQDNDPNVLTELSIPLLLPDGYATGQENDTIKIGGTAIAVFAYQLDDLETPVTLKAKDLAGYSYGEQTFTIR